MGRKTSFAVELVSVVIVAVILSIILKSILIVSLTELTRSVLIALLALVIVRGVSHIVINHNGDDMLDDNWND